MNRVECVSYLDQMTKAIFVGGEKEGKNRSFEFGFERISNLPDFLSIHGMDKAPHRFQSNRDKLHLAGFRQPCSTSNTVYMNTNRMFKTTLTNMNCYVLSNFIEFYFR